MVNDPKWSTFLDRQKWLFCRTWKNIKMNLFYFDKCICIVVSLISICLALCLARHSNIDGCNRFHPGLNLWINQQYLMDSTNIDQYWGQFQHVAASSWGYCWNYKLLWLLDGVGTSTWMICWVKQSKQTRTLISHDLRHNEFTTELGHWGVPIIVTKYHFRGAHPSNENRQGKALFLSGLDAVMNQRLRV